MNELSEFCAVMTQDGSKWIIQKNWFVRVGRFVITVPKGFESDGASVPKVLWSFIAPFGNHLKAAIVHDFLYSKKNDTGINKTLADRIFMKLMEQCGVSRWKMYSMGGAVKLFGKSHWDSKECNEGYVDKALFDNTDEAKVYYSAWKEVLDL